MTDAFACGVPSNTVAVLDDDADLGATVARLLGRNGIAARAFTAPGEVLAALGTEHFACVVSDIQMGEMDGFAFADALRAKDPATALVFMTAWPITAHAVDAVRRHGGLDYLEKPIDEARLIAAVSEGLAWSVRERRVAALAALLTRREREVLGLMVRGYTNKEMAPELGISERTVEDHRASIIAKTRTNGMAQLVALSRGEEI